MTVDTTIVLDNAPFINPRGAMLFDLHNLSLRFDAFKQEFMWRKDIFSIKASKTCNSLNH